MAASRSFSSGGSVPRDRPLAGDGAPHRSEYGSGATVRRFAVLPIIVALVMGACSSPTATVAAPATTVADGDAVEGASWAIQITKTHATIAVVDADGGSQFSPTAGLQGGDQTNPDWSPDGSMLALVMNDGTRDDLWITNLDGSSGRLLFDCENPCDFIDDPAWSPAGTSIAVCLMSVNGNDHLSTLVEVDVDTGQVADLFTPESPNTYCAGPRWSPDGRSIVLELADRDGTSIDSNVIGVTLSIVDLTTTPATVRPLTDPALFAATADWNKSGDLIVFSALVEPGGDKRDLFSIAPDGSGFQRLTFRSDNGGSATHPSFDAAGATVVFVSDGVLKRLDLASGETTPAFTRSVQGEHPRPRPAR